MVSPGCAEAKTEARFDGFAWRSAAERAAGTATSAAKPREMAAVGRHRDTRFIFVGAPLSGEDGTHRSHPAEGTGCGHAGVAARRRGTAWWATGLTSREPVACDLSCRGAHRMARSRRPAPLPCPVGSSYEPRQVEQISL